MSTFHYRINVEPCAASPEPVIGPGMILERGRTRILITDAFARSGELYTRVQRRWPFRRWPIGWYRSGIELYRNDIALMLADGWTVIRPSDPTSQQGKE